MDIALLYVVNCKSDNIPCILLSVHGYGRLKLHSGT